MKISLLSCLIVCSTIIPTRADLLGQYTFTGATIFAAPSTFAADASPNLVTLSSIKRGSGVSGKAVANAFAGTGWSLAFSPTDDFEFTVSRKTGTTAYNLTSIELDLTRGTLGPQTWSIRSSLDSYQDDVGISTTFAPAQSVSLNMSGETGSITFRIYGWNSATAGDVNDTLTIDNVRINGSVVPEPSTYLAGVGLFCLVGIAEFFRRLPHRHLTRDKLIKS